MCSISIERKLCESEIVEQVVVFQPQSLVVEPWLFIEKRNGNPNGKDKDRSDSWRKKGVVEK